MYFVVYNSTCTWFRFTWHIPPASLVKVVQIMLSSSKTVCHFFSHLEFNCNFSVFSFSTSEAGLSCPVLPHPATVHLMLAGIFPFFFGSPIVFTNLLRVAFFSNCKREQRRSGNHSSLLLLFSTMYLSDNSMCVYFLLKEHWGFSWSTLTPHPHQLLCKCVKSLCAALTLQKTHEKLKPR